MGAIPTIPVPAHAYGEDDIDLEHQLRDWGPIGDRTWKAQLRNEPGGVVIASFVVTATDVDRVDGEGVTHHDVHVLLHLAGTNAAVATLPGSTWFDIREIRTDLAPFTLFRRQLLHKRVLTHVD